MDLEYFKKQIGDELCGAKGYIMHALEIQSMSPSWVSTLKNMSAEELNHAEHLFKMFQDYYKKVTSGYTSVPDWMSDIAEEITKMYAEGSAKVKYMHELVGK